MLWVEKIGIKLGVAWLILVSVCVNLRFWPKLASLQFRFFFFQSINFIFLFLIILIFIYICAIYLQSSCCKPPKYCGFEFHNETNWIVPKSGPAVPDKDCKLWSNVQTQLCFDCLSCQISFHDNIKREWRTLAVINVIILILVIIVYATGCCAFRSNRRRRSSYNKYRLW